MSLVRCPECHGSLNHSSPALTCRSCGRTYGRTSGDFLDLRPQVAFEERTKYLDEALHADARHERVSPPLLGSKIRNDMLRAVPCADFPRCGRRSRMRERTRADVESRLGLDERRNRHRALFRARCATQVDLLIGDLRRLPFADASFTKAFSLDVLEHLSPEALRGDADGGRAGDCARRIAVRLHPRAQERPDRRRAALGECSGAATGSRRPDRSQAGTPAQVRPSESARGHP